MTDLQTDSSWPPGEERPMVGLDGVDFIQILQQWAFQVASLNKTLVERTHEMDRYKQEVNALRMLSGISDKTELSPLMANVIVTHLSNATVMDLAKGDVSRPSLLQRIGIQASQNHINIPALSMCNEDYLSLVQQINILQARVEEERQKLASSQEKNLVLCNHLNRLSNDLSVVNHELKSCRSEREETQTSCKSHLIVHENKLREKEQEVSKYRKLITELRITIEQQYNDIKNYKHTTDSTDAKCNKTNKSLQEARKQVEKHQRDIDHKSNAIKLLQKSLKEANDKCLQVQDTVIGEKRKFSKRIHELEGEVDKAKQLWNKMLIAITQKDKLITQQKTEMATLDVKVVDMRRQNGQLTTELAERYSTLEKLNESETILRASLREQAAKLQALSTQPQMSITEKKESLYILIHEQLRFMLEKVLKGEYSHLVKCWQSEWLRHCKAEVKLHKAHDVVGKDHFPGICFTDPGRQKAHIKATGRLVQSGGMSPSSHVVPSANHGNKDTESPTKVKDCVTSDQQTCKPPVSRPTPPRYSPGGVPRTRLRRMGVTSTGNRKITVPKAD